MTGIILIGHGNIATGMQSAVKLIFGEPENFQAIDFTQDVIPSKRKIREGNRKNWRRNINFKRYCRWNTI